MSDELNAKLVEVRLTAAEVRVSVRTILESLNVMLEVIPEKADPESLAILGDILDRMAKVQRHVAPFIVSCGQAYEALGESLAAAHRLLDAEPSPG